MSEEEKRGDKYGLILRPEFLPLLPKSTSIWGDLDILNSKESSEVTLGRVKQLVDEVDLKEGIYIGMRQISIEGKYRLPLQVFNTHPEQLDLSFDDWVTFTSGPLTCSEAIAAGYLLETAEIARDILEGNLDLEESEASLAFEEIAEKIGGRKRFVPLGMMTIYDYIARMVHYRHVKGDLEELDMSEDNDHDLAHIIGLGIVPLARAFREDGYRIGDNFQATIDILYIGNRALFIPFAGALDGHPKTEEDWQMVGLGFYTGVRLFRLIEEKFSSKND